MIHTIYTHLTCDELQSAAETVETLQMGEKDALIRELADRLGLALERLSVKDDSIDWDRLL